MKPFDPYYLPRFSHVYVEKSAFSYPLTKSILEKLQSSQIVEINDYKDIFSRKGQDFQEQKKSLKLILAVKKENYLYQGSEAAPDFGYSEFYYNTPALNCVYNCDYCYLQGIYPSANIVIFVNIDDFFREIEVKLNQDLYVCISYDTDLLALENITGLVAQWTGFAAKNPKLLLEIRTKSASFKTINHITPLQNVILAWTLSPDEIVRRYEKRTPRIEQRLESLKQAAEAGWPVRVCIDPVLFIPNWEQQYQNLINEIFTTIPAGQIRDISLGFFRMNSEFLKKIKKQRNDSDILFYPYATEGSVKTYDSLLTGEMKTKIYHMLQKYIAPEKIVFTIPGEFKEPD